MFAEFLELEEDRLGLSLQPGSVCVQKDSQNLIGISIGGGAPLCPCLYIVQVGSREKMKNSVKKLDFSSLENKKETK